MGIAGLGTYSSSSYYYASVSRNRNNLSSEMPNDFSGLITQNGGNNVATADSNTHVARPSYTRCITANIMTEEMFAAKNDSGEMIYSYQPHILWMILIRL